MSELPGMVATLAYEGLCTFEFGIAIEIFGLQRPELQIPWYQHQVIAVDAMPLKAAGGVRIMADSGLEGLAMAHTIIIPGWRSLIDEPPAPLLEALCNAHERGTRLLSICSGVFVLAATGLLDGKRATTHWRFAHELASRFPRIEVDPNVLYVDAGQLITSAGSAAGIDACLHLVARDHGTHVANTVARRLVMAPQRSGGQSQFIPSPISRAPRNELSHLLQWIRERLDQPFSIQEMAAKVAMSERTFLRRFKETTGLAPKVWLQQERIGRARDLLESTADSTSKVAETCGFNSVESFRVAFRTTVGIAPSAYRKQFGDRRIAASSTKRCSAK
ncbi:transcriptional regulator [Pseudomonas oryzihabitans]|nr:transcriptional regulator [Pseudomonas psychrotolerans]